MLPAQLASAPALGQQGPSSPRDQRAIVHQGNSGFLIMARILRTSCFILNPFLF